MKKIIVLLCLAITAYSNANTPATAPDIDQKCYNAFEVLMFYIECKEAAGKNEQDCRKCLEITHKLFTETTAPQNLTEAALLNKLCTAISECI